MKSPASLASLAFALPLGLVACGGPTTLPSYAPVEVTPTPVAAVDPAPVASAPAPRVVRDVPKVGPSTESDPYAETPFTLENATAGLAGSGPLVATIRTSLGDLSCRLFDDKAPIAVATFVGLARGTRPWKAPGTEGWVQRAAYDGTTFHRIIPGFMIQGGDPEGTGRGEPGFVFKDEIWPGARHDRAGLLCAANRGPNTNGMQFFITDAPAKHLDRSYTIYGECAPTSVVHAIAGVPTGAGNRPTNAVTISAVEISRAKP
jgi:peptidyl-prolyl cis-trans isomerase A (cyclophilin A)